MKDQSSSDNASGFEILYEDECIGIARDGTNIDMRVGGVRWNRRYEELANRFKVTKLYIDESTVKGTSLAFLHRIPSLTGLQIVAYAPFRLEALEGHANLGELHLNWGSWNKTFPTPVVDFTTLPKLAKCSIYLRPEFESIFRCRSLNVLYVTEISSGVTDLDLTSLRGIQDLGVFDFKELRSVEVHPGARLLKLRMDKCERCRLDWKRIGRDLQYLNIGGELGFTLDEIRHAPKLEELRLDGVRSQSLSLSLLKGLPKLHTVSVSPMSPKDVNSSLIREINAKGGHGPVLSPEE